MTNLKKKCRLCRREGEKLFLKGKRCSSSKCPINEKDGVAVSEDHGSSRRLRMSGYGKQLREKQKLKRIYGVSETRLRNYLEEAENTGGSVAENFLRFLEIRLDNVLYRLGIIPSRATARQLVGHGHVLVNGKKVTIPSYRVAVGDEIRLSDKAVNMRKIQEWLTEEKETAGWLERKGLIGKVAQLPKAENLDLNIDESLVIEFYSRS